MVIITVDIISKNPNDDKNKHTENSSVNNHNNIIKSIIIMITQVDVSQNSLESHRQMV